MIFGEGPIIKNIAGDLNKLFLQGTRGSQPIINVEGDAAADQATIQLMADRDPVIRDISTGLGWAGREVTVSGTGALQLVNSIGRPLKSWSVELAPYQVGSGDPSPENVRRIYGTNQLTMWTCGKNLYSKEDSAYNVPVYAQDGTSASYPDVAVWWMPVKPNTQYTVSCNHNEQIFYFRWINCDANKGFINRVGGTYTEIMMPVTFTTPNNCRWVQIAINQYDADRIALNDWEVMIVEGSVSADYEPYNGSQTLITLPQTVYTGTVSSDGGENIWGEVDLETLNWDPSSPDRNVFRSDSLVGTITPSSTGRTPTDAICEQFTAMAWGPISQSDNKKFAVADINSFSAGRIVFIDFRNTSIPSFTSAVTGVKLVFPALNPQTFPLAASIIPTIEGDGSIWITAEDGIITNFSVTYLQGE